MGAHTPIPFSKDETKAFNVFMKKYIKHHKEQNEDECYMNGTNAWGKLTTQQKMFFAVRPRAVAVKKRAPTPKKKQSGKHKRVLGGAAKQRGKKISGKLAKSLQFKFRKPRHPDRHTRAFYG